MMGFGNALSMNNSKNDEVHVKRRILEHCLNIFLNVIRNHLHEHLFVQLD